MRIIVNPKAAGGRVGRDWPRVEARIRIIVGDVDVVYTRGTMSAAYLVRSAIESGEREVTVVGGDGTVNEAVNGLIKDDNLADPGLRLTIIPVGSGCDYARSLGIPSGLEGATRILQSDRYISVDVGRATYRGFSGEEETRYFANIIEAGAGGEVVQRVNRSSKPLGGKAAFTWAIISTLLSYKNKAMDVVIDGESVSSGPMNGVVVANGKYYGSGLKPAPKAELDDGLLDVVIIGDVRLGEAIRSLRKLKHGDHIDHPKVGYHTGAEVSVLSSEDVIVEMDGEPVGMLPMRVTLLNRLLRVRVL